MYSTPYTGGVGVGARYPWRVLLIASLIFRWIPLALLLVFVIFLPVGKKVHLNSNYQNAFIVSNLFYVSGWGSVTYILVSEIVPTAVRTETAVLCNSWEQLLQFGVLQLVSLSRLSLMMHTFVKYLCQSQSLCRTTST